MSLSVFWFRRDLRLDDNAGLYHALKEQGANVQPIFIFDTDILSKLKNPSDKRVPFIHQQIRLLQKQLRELGSDLWVFYGKPLDVFKQLSRKHTLRAVYTNHDYETYAIERDKKVADVLEAHHAALHTFKDQVIFEKDEVLSQARKPYTVYTPFKKKWLESLSPFYLKSYPTEKYFKALRPKSKEKCEIPTLKEMGFSDPGLTYPSTELSKKILKDYSVKRDFPALAATSRLGLHLRFGTLSIRETVRQAQALSPVWVSELVWREFFMQILFHFPHVEKSSFRPEFEKVEWRDSRSDFQKWSEGQTGYPLVDAGMRELNATGFMHNRARMVTASFLTKHLLMHWSTGERYFARELLDYDLAVNNGNWQWAAGTGCDAAPYFRIFNPETQLQKFDADFKYVRKWIPEFETSKYPKPMIEHAEARDRALRAFAKALKGKTK